MEMSKGIEAFRKIFYENDIKDKKDLEENLSIIEQALLELKAIKEANPSEAMKELNLIKDWIEAREIENSSVIMSCFPIIEQALQKAQEQEKVLKILFEKKVELMDLFLSSSVEQYNNQFIRDENKLTQEEFDLLKEYFKWKRK